MQNKNHHNDEKKTKYNLSFMEWKLEMAKARQDSRSVFYLENQVKFIKQQKNGKQGA